MALRTSARWLLIAMCLVTLACATGLVATALHAADAKDPFEPPDGKPPSRSMPRAGYAGDFDPAQIPGGWENLRKRADIDEMIECALQPRPHDILLRWTEGKGEQLEFSAVVVFEQAGGEMCGGMLVEIGGKIAEADAL